MLGQMHRPSAALALLSILAACKSESAGDADVIKQLPIVAGMLETELSRVEPAVAKGAPCRALVNNSGVEHVLGPPKVRQTFVDQFDILTIGLGVYKSSASSRFEALAARFNAFDSRYKAAIEGCRLCLTAPNEPTTDVELAREIDRKHQCAVP